MKKVASTILFAAVLAVASLSSVNTSNAEEIKMTGIIEKVKVSADGKSAVAVVKDNKTEKTVDISISDDLTLEKIKDKRILEGDEVRTKYEKEGGKNTSKMFKKTAGC